MRAEVRPTERRAPVVPADVRRLVDAGFRVTVEESAQRVFDHEEDRRRGLTVSDGGVTVIGKGVRID